MSSKISVNNQENDITNKIADNLMLVLPIIHKILLKVDPPNLSTKFRISRLHIGILASIHHHKMLSSEIARKFIISKPQITYLINLMTDAGMIKKRTNKRDKRITDLSLTSKGIGILTKCEDFYKNNVKEKLSSLNKDDLEALSASLVKLIEIGRILTPA
jgi:DNA-binding MarR family transcriptional regulator